MANVSSRVALLEEVNNSGDIDRIMQLYPEHVRFSDFAFGAVNMQKPEIREFFGGFLSGNKGVTFHTRHAHGSDNLFAWEVDLTFISGADIEKFSVKKGQEVLMKGVSLTRWENDLIVEQKDYFFMESAK